MKTYSLIAALVLVAGVQTAAAAGDAQAGKDKAQVCAACHGVDGNSAAPNWPNLAGQHAAYISKQLADFQAGEQRKDAVMMEQVKNLTPEEMANLGAYFATLTPAGGFVSKESLPLGERTYRGGNQASGVPACLACHGPNGAGDPMAGVPALSGQRAAYTVSQLNAFRSGVRANDRNATMRTASRWLSDEEIHALSEYIAGLH
ncbi:MAG: cytochrome c4 [Lysobacterales bacterium]|nr:MAG: cytochrome c4 [Xanthomonadales bacterium]